VNTFFRLDSPGVISGVRAAFDGVPAQPGQKDVFLLLRRLRNRW
jgi:hypothetical protein